MQSLVSVIIPVYNVENYLYECVESVLNQTYKNLEIILVNDGSTDTSGDLCNELSKKDPRITVIDKSNGGLSDARNAGLDIARGEYYYFLDSDDYISSETVEVMVNSIEECKSDISVCNMISFFEDGKTLRFYVPSLEKKVLSADDRFETLRQPSVCNKLFRSYLFENVRFPKGRCYEDTFVYHVLAYKANSIVLTGYNGYWYRQRQGSIIANSKYTNKYFDYIDAIYERFAFLCVSKVKEKIVIECALSFYAAYSDAFKNICLNSFNECLFSNAKQKYSEVYGYLKKKKSLVSIKQWIRLILLRYLPTLHCKLY